jgi:hypothetical protein
LNATASQWTDVPLQEDRSTVSPVCLVGWSGSSDITIAFIFRNELIRDLSFSPSEAVWPRIVQAYEHDLVLPIVLNAASREDCRRRLP